MNTTEIPPVPEQNRMRDEMNQRINERVYAADFWFQRTQKALHRSRMTESKLQRLEAKYSRLQRFARKLQNYSKSQTEYIKRT